MSTACRHDQSNAYQLATNATVRRYYLFAAEHRATDDLFDSIANRVEHGFMMTSAQGATLLAAAAKAAIDHDLPQPGLIGHQRAHNDIELWCAEYDGNQPILVAFKDRCRSSGLLTAPEQKEARRIRRLQRGLTLVPSACT